MVGRRMVHFSPESRICYSASSRIRFEWAGSVVCTAVVETKTARSMAAALVAATIARACPKPSDARLTRASQCAVPKYREQPRRIIEVAGERLVTAPRYADGGRIAAGQRHRLVAPPRRLGQHVSAQEAAAPGNQ